MKRIMVILAALGMVGIFALAQMSKPEVRYAMLMGQTS